MLCLCNIYQLIGIYHNYSLHHFTGFKNIHNLSDRETNYLMLIVICDLEYLDDNNNTFVRIKLNSSVLKPFTKPHISYNN